MYQYAKSLVKRFAGEKDGASLVEYAILVGLIAVISITAVAAFGTNIQEAFQGINTDLDAQAPFDGS